MRLIGLSFVFLVIMYLLGISAFYHDSAAVLLLDGEIVAAAQEERFTRKKQDDGFPKKAVEFCLNKAGVVIDDLEAVVFYDKPFLKFERLLETYFAFAPKGLRSFIAAMPVWMDQKLFLKRLIKNELEEIMDYDKKNIKVLYSEHHLSHVASCYFPSNLKDSAILTIDGVGEWATASICYGEMEKVTMLKELKFPHSLGLLYSAFTYYLGFKVNSGEYKLMGLAPYGDPKSERTARFRQTIEDKLIEIKEDGSIWLDQQYFNYAAGLRMAEDKKWEALFGIPRRKEETDMQQVHCDMALAIQQVTEKIVLKMAAHAKEITGSKNICLSGGVALNCVANGKLVQSGLFEEVYIQPAAGDAGGALGAALGAYHIHYGHPRKYTDTYDKIRGSYLGPSFGSDDIALCLQKFKANSTEQEDIDSLSKTVAGHLADGKVVGWFQGAMEWGPRALGNRSILADPRNGEMQLKLNLKIKYREGFRPFAPSALPEDAKRYFDLDSSSPYMLLTAPVREEERKPLPEGYTAMPMKEKLYFQRSSLPAITHIDHSARVQTVTADTNERYHSLITAFKTITGVGVLVNTSFNVRGEPIVCTPEDAYRCFMDTEMDVLVLCDYVLLKEDQPAWTKTRKFELD